MDGRKRTKHLLNRGRKVALLVVEVLFSSQQHEGAGDEARHSDCGEPAPDLVPADVALVGDAHVVLLPIARTAERTVVPHLVRAAQHLVSVPFARKRVEALAHFGLRVKAAFDRVIVPDVVAELNEALRADDCGRRRALAARRRAVQIGVQHAPVLRALDLVRPLRARVARRVHRVGRLAFLASLTLLAPRERGGVPDAANARRRVPVASAAGRADRARRAQRIWNVPSFARRALRRTRLELRQNTAHAAGLAREALGHARSPGVRPERALGALCDGADGRILARNALQARYAVLYVLARHTLRVCSRRFAVAQALRANWGGVKDRALKAPRHAHFRNSATPAPDRTELARPRPRARRVERQHVRVRTSPALFAPLRAI
jgi:hypothetical protein